MELENRPTSTTRRVKNPETFRERALKATALKDSSQSSRRSLSARFALLKTIFRPLAKMVKSLAKVPGLKPVFMALNIIVPRYFRTSFIELKKVAWPSLKQSLKLTYAVLAFAVVFGSAIALLDYGLDKVFKTILLK